MLRVLKPASDISPGSVLGMVVTNLSRGYLVRQGNPGKLPYHRRKITLPLGAELPYLGHNISYEATTESIGLFVTQNTIGGSNMSSMG